MKAEPNQLIPRKPTEKLELLIVVYLRRSALVACQSLWQGDVTRLIPISAKANYMPLLLTTSTRVLQRTAGG